MARRLDDASDALLYGRPSFDQIKLLNTHRSLLERTERVALDSLLHSHGIWDWARPRQQPPATITFTAAHPRLTRPPGVWPAV